MLSRQEALDHQKNIVYMRRQRQELSEKIEAAERTTEIEELKKNLETQILYNSNQASTIGKKNREIGDLSLKVDMLKKEIVGHHHVIDDQSNLLIKARVQLDSVKDQCRDTDNALRDRIEAAHANTEEVRTEKESMIASLTDELFRLRKRTRQYDTITVCSSCAGVMIKIRGKFPQDSDRWACATCTTEKLEQIHESTASDFNQASTEVL